MNISEKNLDFSNVGSQIEHLDKSKVIDLIRRYYDGESVTRLLLEYGIRVHTSKLSSLFPPVISENLCIHCKANMVVPWKSKSYESLLDEKKSYCPNCRHNDSEFCRCSNCEIARKQRETDEKIKQKIFLEQKRETIKRLLDETSWDLINECELTLKERLYLAVVLRSSLSEDTMYIEPLVSNRHRLAPTSTYEVEIINTLANQNIIVPHELSDVSCFDVNCEDDSFHYSYDSYKVKYRINIEPCDLNYNEMIKRLLYPDMSSEEGYKEFCYEMWKTISLNECLEYLLFQMNKVRYNFNPGEKTIRVFENLLEHFSVAQIYCIIYRAIANSTQRYQAREISLIHAKNSVITSCELLGQRALAQGWKLSHYSRIRDLPETYISMVLFTSIMQIDELGFSEKPTIDF